MRSSTSVTRSSRTLRCIAPSPSTRASTLVAIVRVLGSSALIGATLVPERRCLGVEGAVDAHEVDLPHAVVCEPPAQRVSVWRLHRPEAPVAPPVIGGAERAAAGVGNRPQAWGAVGNHHA